MKLAGIILLAGGVLGLAPSAVGQTSSICDVIAQHPVFTSSTISTSDDVKQKFRLLQCSADWKSSSDAQNAGIGIDIPIYGLQIPLSANWDQTKVETWKSSHCSQEERSASYSSALFASSYAVDPVTAHTTLACLTSLLDKKALRCDITETSSAVVFEAEWRRTNGEVGQGPKVGSFAVTNATCLNADALGAGKLVPEGGVTVLCTAGDAPPVFALNTDRGQCFAAGNGKEDVLGITGTIALDKATTFRAKRIKFAPDSKIVTNGFPLRIQADTLEMTGSPQIVSFIPTPLTPMKPGRYAAPIFVGAQKVVGAGLSILNVGEDGGPGLKGPTGQPGAPGGPGSGRTTNWRKNCPIPLVCDIIPTGCEGGSSGGNGTSGVQGFPGYAGTNGGAAGEVTLALPPSDSDSITVLTNTALSGSVRQCAGLICGGLGGTGGPGGDGGPGGPGGPGAPGTTYCGGTDGGNSGPQGPPGPPGPPGPAGAGAVVHKT